MIKWYENYLKERKQVLDKIGSKQKIKEYENLIKKEFFFNLEKNKNNYYSSRIFSTIPLLRKYFRFFAVITDRNKGKSFDSRAKMVLNYHAGKRSMLLRNRIKELDALISSAGFLDWVEKNNWELEKSKYNINDLDGNTVIYLRALNDTASTKSIDYLNLNLVIYDEFDSEIKIKNKFSKLSHLMTTIGRFDDTLQIYLLSNYENIYDEIFLGLGIDVSKSYKNQITFFNWISGAVLFFIPNNYFLTGSDKNLLGKRLALSSPDAYQKQYSSTYKLASETNFTTYDKVKNSKYIFTIIYENIEISIFKTVDNLIYAESKSFQSNKIFVCFREKDRVHNINAKTLSPLYIPYLKELFLRDKLKVTNLVTHENLKRLFKEN